ncbi:NACHT domain-containing protein [Fibrobacter succinogenes]|uniref:NACHT domain-containing protein n=1 Tax=Fibrobacter succinogenes TaxID=833 RepID=A0A380S6B0_FIBSU|nr:hypothetical protein [Fibrobacter succinogenes]PWJ35878.1 hypothetical protein IE02_1939 [Fibrobacter succinogenes subsp. elongatus]SUQ24533.1 hypothetical protein SAMN05661053_1939 [Fibrobacter succinogenes]
MSNQELEQLRMLADPHGDFIVDGDEILFYRAGKEYNIKVRRDASLGLIVSSQNGKKIEDLPFLKYVKDCLIGFPTLATQVIKHVNQKNKEQKECLIQSPIKIDDECYGNGVDALITQFINPPIFSTGLIQLMAPAGQGKSILLDMVSYALAKDYTGEHPLLLNIDLLGRFVGSIEDAIAGALNNVYYFPMSQIEIMYAIKNRWIVLALDGFDELISRVGAKGAFLKLTSLIDQLDGCGYLLISARESFFESQEIKISSQAYLTPQIGTYEKKDSVIMPWQHEQRKLLISKYVNANLLKLNSDNICSEIEKIFDNDEELLKNPFFLTKIIEWYFEDRGNALKIESNLDSFARIQRVIEKYIEREAMKKWLDSDGNQISTMDDHRNVLGVIAEELFRSPMLRLSAEELKICAELALTASHTESKKIEAFSEKIKIHSVFSVVDNQYIFSHIQFSNYYLAIRILDRIKQCNFDDLETFYTDKEIPKEVVTWLKWLLKSEKIDVKLILNKLESKLKIGNLQFLKNNVSKLIVLILNNRNAENSTVNGLMLMGDDFDDIFLKNVLLKNSDIYQLNLLSSSFENVKVENSKVFSIQLDVRSKYLGIKIDQNTEINGITSSDGKDIYSPRAISKILSECGVLENERYDDEIEKDVPENVKEVVARMISKSNKHFYFSSEEVEEETGNLVYDIVKKGIEHEIFKERETSTRTLISICVDKQMLIEGAEKTVSNEKINAFWSELAINT